MKKPPVTNLIITIMMTCLMLAFIAMPDSAIAADTGQSPSATAATTIVSPPAPTGREIKPANYEKGSLERDSHMTKLLLVASAAPAPVSAPAPMKPDIQTDGVGFINNPKTGEIVSLAVMVGYTPWEQRKKEGCRLVDADVIMKWPNKLSDATYLVQVDGKERYIDITKDGERKLLPEDTPRQAFFLAAIIMKTFVGPKSAAGTNTKQ